MKSHIILFAALVLLTIIEIGESRAGYYYRPAYGSHGNGYGGQGNSYGGHGNSYGRSYGYRYRKRGMKKIASRQQTNIVPAELKSDAGIEHLVEDEHHKA